MSGHLSVVELGRIEKFIDAVQQAEADFDVIVQDGFFISSGTAEYVQVRPYYPDGDESRYLAVDLSGS